MLRRLFVVCSVLGSALTAWSPVAFAEPAPKANPGEARQAAVDESDDPNSAEDESDRPSRKPRQVTPEQSTATHKQVRIIKPAHDGKPVTLDTFCLAANGNLLACVAVGEPESEATDTQPTNSKPGLSFVQTYSPDGKLLQEVSVPFHATAINVGSKGAVFIAGEGKFAKIIEGKLSAVTSTPHIGDYEAFKKKVVAAAKEEMAEFCKSFKDEIKELQKRIDPLEARAKDKALSKRDQAKLTSLKQSLAMQEAQIKAFDRTADEEELVRDRLVVTALGVTDQDVFFSVMGAEGHGYEVWRTNHDFREPKKVVTHLSGCCGQLDIQARGDRLFVAENGKFEVSVRDRDGKRLSGFGRRDRSGVDGFGSCCNPMNLRCCSNGDILAAESSIGNIKRFDKNGDFAGLVGKAKIGIGCKHVALAFDESRDRYYMMNVDKAHIAVLVPLAEVPAETETEKAVRAAREEFSKRLAGRWARAGIDPVKKVKGAVAGLIGSLTGDDEDGGGAVDFSGDPFNQITFGADGKLVLAGGAYSQFFDDDGTWEAVELNGKVLEIAFLSGGADFISARVEMTSDDELKIRVQNYGSEEFGEPIACQRDKNTKAVKSTRRSR
jgi:hypothetical protein